MNKLKKQDVIKILARKNNQEEIEIKNILITLLLNIIIDEARRLQLSQAIIEKRILYPKESNPIDLVQESYKSIIENDLIFKPLFLNVFLGFFSSFSLLKSINFIINLRF